MADKKLEPPAAKRMRKSNLRDATVIPQIDHRYMLRSCARTNGDEFKFVELPPPQRTRNIPKGLMVLNDDCLLEMFTFLRPRDLRNVSQVNVRLNGLVKYYVKLKYNIHAQSSPCFDLTTNDGEPMSFETAKLYLKIFGYQIRSLCLSEQLLPDIRQVRKLWQHCNASVLIVKDYRFSSDFIVECFDQMEELRIMNKNDNFFFNTDRILKRLSIVNCPSCLSLNDQYIRRLENLEEFELKLFRQTTRIDTDLKFLLAFKKLKVLKFGFTNKTEYSVSQILNGFSEREIAIEHLELWSGRGDDGTSESIAKLKTIKILKLNNLIGLRKTHIKHLAKELKSLQELHIRTDAEISENDIIEIVNLADRLACLKIEANGIMLDSDSYNKLLTTVRNRPKANKLELAIYGDGKEQLVMNQPLEERWLTVKQLNRKQCHLFDDLTAALKPSIVYFAGQRRVYNLSDDEYSVDSDDDLEDEEEEAEEEEFFTDEDDDYLTDFNDFDDSDDFLDQDEDIDSDFY